MMCMVGDKGDECIGIKYWSDYSDIWQVGVFYKWIVYYYYIICGLFKLGYDRCYCVSYVVQMYWNMGSLCSEIIFCIKDGVGEIQMVFDIG